VSDWSPKLNAYFFAAFFGEPAQQLIGFVDEKNYLDRIIGKLTHALIQRKDDKLCIFPRQLAHT
jgi:hypothetical protein